MVQILPAAAISPTTTASHLPGMFSSLPTRMSCWTSRPSHPRRGSCNPGGTSRRSKSWGFLSQVHLRTWTTLALPCFGALWTGVSFISYALHRVVRSLTVTDIVAAGASSAAVQAAIINTTHAYLTDGLHSVPFGTKYNVEGPEVGKWIGNRARSTVGSNFALLALKDGYWGKFY
jgi:hypothetical protein